MVLHIGMVLRNWWVVCRPDLSPEEAAAIKQEVQDFLNDDSQHELECEEMFCIHASAWEGIFFFKEPATTRFLSRLKKIGENRMSCITSDGYEYRCWVDELNYPVSGGDSSPDFPLFGEYI